MNGGRLSAWCVAGVAAIVARGPAAGQCQYEVTIIVEPVCQYLPYPTTVAYAVNETGHVAGLYHPCVLGAPRGFVWTPEDGFVPLSLPNGAGETPAYGISDTGEIAGYFVLPDSGFSNLTLYLDDEGELVEIGVLPGGDMSEAFSVRDGVVVGWSRSDASSRVAYRWKDGVMTSLAPDLGTPKSDAMDMNDRGHVTGWIGTSFGFDGNAYIWDDGLVTVLPPIPGGVRSAGLALNNRGDVVGAGRRINEQSGEVERRAFAWIHETMFEIPPIAGTTRSSAQDVNDARQVVGYSWIDAPLIGFLWQGGVTWNLNDLILPGSGLTVRGARAINERGQIAGWGSAMAGTVGFLLTPVGMPPGDLNIDCRVGIVDLLALLARWGPCEQPDECPADLDGDGVVGAADFAMLVMNWG